MVDWLQTSSLTVNRFLQHPKESVFSSMIDYFWISEWGKAFAYQLRMLAEHLPDLCLKSRLWSLTSRRSFLCDIEKMLSLLSINFVSTVLLPWRWSDPLRADVRSIGLHRFQPAFIYTCCRQIVFFSLHIFITFWSVTVSFLWLWLTFVCIIALLDTLTGEWKWSALLGRL